ncbi:hypothetical protein ACFOSD_04000 [Salinispirillum marinum]|uniref:Uncharacterized protein n=2 Tax=Saccharospirillaceae TaxID=255527 RepID=A0ABV8BDX8_9GAMM
MAAFNRYQSQFALQSESTLAGWLTMAASQPELPTGFSFLPADTIAAPARRAMRPDLLPLCERADGKYLCAQLSPMGRVVQYGEWCECTGWSPWSAHWEAVLVALWATAALTDKDFNPEAFVWMAPYWRAVQEQVPSLVDWQEFSALRGPYPLMMLLDKGVAPYMAVMALSTYADHQPDEAPEALASLLTRERCRLWRCVDPSENAFQRVVKAVYAVQAMRRGEFEGRRPTSTYALHLVDILQEHWACVPEPLRTDHLIMAARDGRSAVMAQAWLNEANERRAEQQFGDACRAKSQAWSIHSSSITDLHLNRWMEDTLALESACWSSLLYWHQFLDAPTMPREASPLALRGLHIGL